MILRNKTFNHETSNFRKALNVPKEIMESAIEKIIFSTVCNALAVNEMYDDRESAPNELTTVTGDLQKTLSFVSGNQEEYEVILLLFRHYHELTQSVLKHYMLINSKEIREDEEMYKKAVMLEKLLHVKEILKEQDDEDEDDSDNISFNNMMKRISFVKKSKYNFGKYLTYVDEMKHKNFKSFFENDD